MPTLRHPGVAFLDRDGTINQKAPEGEYITDPTEVRLRPGAAEAIRRLNDVGVTVIVVTNQRGIALGRMSELDLERVHAELARQLAEEAGARLDAVFYCPHDRGECDCRKPGPGMFRQAEARFPWLDLSRSVVIGDSDSDTEAGLGLGMRTIRIGRDAPDLSMAVDRLMMDGPMWD